MNTLRVALVLAIVFPCNQALIAQSSSDIENLHNALNLSKQTPFDKKAKNPREKAFLSVVETDKVSVTACGDFMSPYSTR